MNYIRVCQGFEDKGKMIPSTQDVYKGLDLTKDYYASAFLYNEDHFKIFKETGTISGIQDTITNKLYWDLDSKDNLNLSKNDAATLCSRLQKMGYYPALFFSGMKGFLVELNFSDAIFTPDEVKNICLNIGDGLATLDKKIYNAARILRIPLTRHKDTGLYKIPLDPDTLSSTTIDDIKEAAVDSMDVADIQGAYELSKVSSKIMELKKLTPKIDTKKVKDVAYDVSEVQWSNKPKFLTPEKYLLSLGFFDSGERSHALMILGSTFKALGFTETQTYHFLKATAELQAERTGDDKFPKKEIYSNVIAQIYSNNWKGGTYSVTNDDLLAELSLIVPAELDLDESSFVYDISQSFSSFVNYAANIDENTIKTGIKDLDDKIRFQAGRLYGLLGYPGSGKTGFCNEILNNTSLLNEHGLFGSYDMSCPDLLQRQIQRHTGLSEAEIYEKIKSDPEKMKKEFSKILHDNYKNITFIFKTGQSITEIKQTIIEREKALGITYRLIVIDYSELVQSKFSDPTQASMETIQGLREIAVGMNKAVFVMLQPSKVAGSIDEPILSGGAAKGSSSILQAVTAMLTIHRPGYNPRAPQYDKFIGIDCVKNRSGPIFSIDLHFNGARGMLRTLNDDERQELAELRARKKADRDDDSKLF